MKMMDKDEDDGLFVALYSVVCLQCERQIMFGHDNVCVCMCVCVCVGDGAASRQPIWVLGGGMWVMELPADSQSGY